MAARGAGAEVSVKPDQIEKELVRIWREAADFDTAQEAAKVGEAPARVRATLSNLILVSSGADRERKKVDPLITELCISHPSRFFILQYDSDSAGEAIETAVSSRCVLANSGAHVCSEEVYVQIRAAGVKLTRNLLLSLTVPDVDGLVVLLCDPEEGSLDKNSPDSFQELLKGLEPLADRVIFDSALLRSFKTGVGLVCRVFGVELKGQERDGEMERFSRDVVLRDVNWSRLYRLRVLVAEQFSGSRFKDPKLGVKAIHLECSISDELLKSGKLPADALLFAGWISNCLDWQLEEQAPLKTEQGVELNAKAGDGSKRTVRFSACSKTKITKAMLISVSITVREDDEVTEFGIRRTDDLLFAETSFCSYQETESRPAAGAGFSRRSPYFDQPLEELLLSNIASSGKDPDLVNSLAQALNIANLITR